MNRNFVFVCLLTAVAAGSAGAREDVDVVSPLFEEVACPAASGASAPFLFEAPGGSVTLSWVEPVGEGGHRLRFATWRDSVWSEARTVAEGDDWFVNWADVPSVVAAGDGRMAAHWLVKSGEDTYAYDIHIAQSFDGGATWGKPLTPHTDGTASEHGFASLRYAGDLLHVVWLDGRKYADENLSDETTLRAARIDRDGNLSGEVEIDARTCDCCPTALSPIAGGLIVAYRDRSPDEIRDISVARFVDGAWEAPHPVAIDGWKIDGCPVNGPAIASDGTNIAVAWFTMNGEKGVVRRAWSHDGGRSFGEPEELDPEGAVGRVATCTSGATVVTGWLVNGDDGAAIDIRFANARYRVVRTSAARQSGYPRVATDGSSLLLAWTQSGDVSRVRVTVARLEQFENMTGSTGE